MSVKKMFGYVTFNVKYYILSQIFYKKIGCVYTIQYLPLACGMIYSFETPQPVVARIALGVLGEELNENCKIKVKMHFYVLELDTLLQQSYSHGRA